MLTCVLTTHVKVFTSGKYLLRKRANYQKFDKFPFKKKS